MNFNLYSDGSDIDSDRGDEAVMMMKTKILMFMMMMMMKELFS